MRLLLSFFALFAAISIMQLGSGVLSPLDVLSGLQAGFSTTAIGLLGSGHFAGFFVGCWIAPRLLKRVGHSRAFAVFAAFGAIGTLAHPMVVNEYAWIIFRLMVGFCVAGSYTVIEAWLQASLTNDNRGKVFGAYRVVDIASSSVAQLLIGWLEPGAYMSYNLVAIFFCACLLPLSISTLTPPKVAAEAPKLRPIKTLLISPLGALGVVVAAATVASFRMVAPIFTDQIGLTPAQIGYFMAVVLVGGAVAQVPVGWLADKFDRRWVLIWLSIASIASCLLLVFFSLQVGIISLLVFAFIFGATTMPIYAVSASHVNDFSADQNAVEINASLMFWYGVGAIFSPLATSSLMEAFSVEALFVAIAAVHVVLVVFGIYRMSVRPTVEIRTLYTWIPRTSFIVSRMLGRQHGSVETAKNTEKRLKGLE